MKPTAGIMKKKIVTVCIMVLIALLHFVTGPQYAGPFRLFVNGYLIDVALAFGLYFLLAIQVLKFFKPWITKALIVFGIGVIVETSQYFGIHILGATFDPLDYAAYGAGVVLAVLFDLYIFSRVFSFWNPVPDNTEQ
jgi:hypothetical protein